ncbi:MAG TPA: glycoside hydrolase family 3 N-terminal domain-containing protein [Steroidobacteraceae bacterium]|jgi:beta-glucosidase|nr:glycoside hydrolase family 3 N-terminal domain-containing protein [Steroidobacteraceae bacterium]
MSRVEALISDMTLTEKLGQLTMTAAGYTVTGPVIAGDSTDAIKAGTIGNLLNLFGAQPVREMQRLAVEESRLGIPLLIGLDVIHGYRTLFPVPLAESALFDPEQWTQTAREAAREAAAAGVTMTFAPMLDVSRDPRWGRSVEGPGEDPWVGAQLARAKVRGFQGDDLAAADTLAAVAKHYCAYGPVTAGREYASVDISERTLLEVHLPSFAAAVAAGVAAVMPAFTDLAGIPMTANAALLRERLRGRLGFEGVIVSDYNAIGELIRHGVAADLSEAAALALQAGVDIDMMADAYRHGLPGALERGLVSMALIDESVRRVLRLKERLGLFDDPYRRGVVAESDAALTRRRALARTVAARAIVLLKNGADTLPLRQGVRRLAVIGPLADASGQMRGPWWAAAEPHGHVTVVAGLVGALPDCQVLHAPGVAVGQESATAAGSDTAAGADGSADRGDGERQADGEGIAAALELCESADAIVLCVGEAAGMSGEAASRARLTLPGRQRELAQSVLTRARALGRPVIAVLFCGRPLIVPWLIEQADAVLCAWFLGSEAGNAIADVLTGAVSPSGRTPISWPRVMGQVPIFYSQRPGGRPANAADPYTSRYLDVPNEPLFAFGHGLTYGRFVLSNLRVTPRTVREHDTIEVCVDVVNEGARAAQETVFLFVHDLLASVARPVLELQGWGRISLAAGERGTVTLQLPASQLRFLDANLNPVFEPGEVEILVGPCADRSQLLAAGVRLAAAPG